MLISSLVGILCNMILGAGPPPARGVAAPENQARRVTVIIDRLPEEAQPLVLDRSYEELSQGDQRDGSHVDPVTHITSPAEDHCEMQIQAYGTYIGTSTQ